MKNKTKLIPIALLLATTLAGADAIINTRTTLATEINANQNTANLFSNEEREEIEKIKTAYLQNLAAKSLQQRLQTFFNHGPTDTQYEEDLKLLVEQLTKAHAQHPQVVDIFCMMHALNIWAPVVGFLFDKDPTLNTLQNALKNHDNEIRINDPADETTDPDQKERTTIDISALYEGTQLLNQLQGTNTGSINSNPPSQTADIIEHIMDPRQFYDGIYEGLGYTPKLVEDLQKLTNMQKPPKPIDFQQLDDLKLIMRNLEIIKQITQQEEKYVTNIPLKFISYYTYEQRKQIQQDIQERITNLDNMIISLDKYIKTTRTKATATTIENLKKTNEKLSIILKALLP